MAKLQKIVLTAENSDRTERRAALVKNAECIQKFRDKSGKVQTIRCTLHPDHTPPFEGQRGGNKRDRITVLNLDKKAWRTVMNEGFISLTYYKEAA